MNLTSYFYGSRHEFFGRELRHISKVPHEEGRSNPLEISKSAIIVHRTSRIMSSAILRNPFSRYIVVILGGRAVRGSEISRRLRLNKGILDCAGRAKRRRRFFHSDLILGHVERQLTREAEQSGVALRFPPHSKTPPYIPQISPKADQPEFMQPTNRNPSRVRFSCTVSTSGSLRAINFA